MSTDDYLALRLQYEETALIPPVDPITGALARAREAYEHLLEVRERFRFGAWIQTLRERQALLEEEATCAWERAVVRSGVVTFKRKGGE
jgi:hypothetical protein